MFDVNVHIFLICEKDCKLVASPQIYLPKVLLDLPSGILLFELTFKKLGDNTYRPDSSAYQQHQAHCLLWQQWIGIEDQLPPWVGSLSVPGSHMATLLHHISCLLPYVFKLKKC